MFDTSLIKGVQLFEGSLRDCQDVWMYTSTNELLTPGSVMLSNEENFQHNCSGTYDSEVGAPIINSNAELVGMNDFFQSNYMTALSIRSIVELIDRSERKDFTSIQNTLQHLRSKG